MTVDIASRWATSSEACVFILAGMTPLVPTQTHLHREGRAEKKHLQVSVSSLGSLCSQREEGCSTTNIIQIT